MSKEKEIELENTETQAAEKSEDVTWAEKDLPQNLTHQHRQIIQFAALGYSASYIAGATEYHPVYIRKLLSTNRFKEEIQQLQSSTFNQVARKHLETHFGNALEVLTEVMNDKTERGSTRAQAASYLLDQAIGKSKQKIETESRFSLADLIERIDRGDIKMSEAQPTRPKDELDKFVDELDFEQQVVGVKKGS